MTDRTGIICTSIYSQLTLSLVLVSMFWCWPRARFHTVHLTRATKYCAPHVVSNTLVLEKVPSEGS